jgi:hypothetical protein
MTPLRIGDRVSVERHERKNTAIVVRSLSWLVFLFSFFFFYTIHESVLLFGHSLWSLDRFLPSIRGGTLFIYLLSPLWPRQSAPRLWCHTRSSYFLCFTTFSPKFSLAYLGFFRYIERGWFYFFDWLGRAHSLGVAAPNGLIWARATHLLLHTGGPFFLSLSLSLGWQVHQLLVY